MAVLNVNPTRMELRRLKERLKVAKRGHKLLKDKTDEMVRQFLILIKENIKLRKEIGQDFNETMCSFAVAKAMSFSSEMENSVGLSSKKLSLKSSYKSFMGIDIPSIDVEETSTGDVVPYSFASTTAQLDMALVRLNGSIKYLVQLAEIEKSTSMIADQIEKNKRRVNALEFIMIPQLEETIKYIRMKLEEQERSSIIRIIKVKELITKDNQ